MIENLLNLISEWHYVWNMIPLLVLSDNPPGPRLQSRQCWPCYLFDARGWRLAKELNYTDLRCFDSWKCNGQRGLRCFFDAGPHKLLNKQSNDRFLATTWCSYDVIVMLRVHCLVRVPRLPLLCCNASPCYNGTRSFPLSPFLTAFSYTLKNGKSPCFAIQFDHIHTFQYISNRVC